MEIFNCFVSQYDYTMAKDKVACIHNYIRRTQDPELKKLKDKQIELKIAKELYKRFKAAKGTKTFLEVANEYYKDLKKEDN